MNQRILAYETSELDLTTLLPIILYIIFFSPTFVNILACTLAFGSVVHNGMFVFLVTRWKFPTLFDFDLYILKFAEGSHTIFRLYEGDKFYQY